MMNPRGPDGYAIAEAVAPAAAATLRRAVDVLGAVVLLLSVVALGLTLLIVFQRSEVVAVSPSGALIPLVQLDGDNEAAVRARLDAGTAQFIAIPSLPEGAK